MALLMGFFFRLIAMVALCGLLACGGGGGGVSITISLGGLALSVVGLPSGANAAVTIAGPDGFIQFVVGPLTISNLPPGNYTVTAANVAVGNALYTPQNTTQNVAVNAGTTAAATVTYTSAPPLRLGLLEVAGGLDSPLFLTAPAGDSRLFIVERPGRIRIVQNGVLLPAPFLDIATPSRVSTVGEGGLLSMAFDPQYATNGYFYIYFTDPTGDIAIERLQVSAANANLADPAGLRIITITHRANTNHKGGLVAFGPDGMLYLATGDGGGAGDSAGNAQNLNSLLGKLLRIDVRNASVMQPYAIPADNPYFNQANRRGEIWADGLRNPWRYAFDAGTVYIADVGQNEREEVNTASAGAAGLDYGWNITEGSLCFPNDPCDRAGFTLPVLEYDHTASGGCSITGGYVYRGTAIPELQGRYFYSDFCNGWLRSFILRNGAAEEQTDWNIVNVGNIFSFGEDAQRELYMLSSGGKVYRIVRQ